MDGWMRREVALPNLKKRHILVQKVLSKVLELFENEVREGITT